MADLDKTLIKVSGLTEEQLEEQRAQRQSLDDQRAKLDQMAKSLADAGITAKKNTRYLEAEAKLSKDQLDFNKKSALEQERLGLLAKDTPLDTMAKEMGSGTFDGIKKFLGATTLFLGGVLLVLKLLQNPKFREGVMSFLNGIKTVYEQLASFGEAVKDDLKGAITGPGTLIGINKLTALFTGKDGPFTKFNTKVTTAITKFTTSIDDFFKAKGLGLSGPGGLMSKIRSIFRPIKTLATTVLKMPIISTFTSWFGKGGTLLKFIGKLFLPFTIIIGVWDTIKGAFEGYSDESEGTWVDKIVGAISGGIQGLINSLVMIPLDFLKSALGWLLGKLGFTGAEEGLSKFSFADTFSMIMEKWEEIMSAIGNWIVGLFTNPVEALKVLWTAIVGEGGLLDILWAPIKGVITWVQGLFPSWETVKEGLLAALAMTTDAAEWLWTTISAPFIGAFEWIKSLFPSWEDVKAGILTVLKYGTAPGWLYLLITGPLKGAFDWIKGLFPSWEDIKQKVMDGIGLIGDAGSWLLGIIKKPFEPLFDFISSIFDFDFLGMVKGIMPQKLYNWMFGTGEMTQADIQAEIEEEQERIARSQSGINEYYGRDSKGIEASNERIEELNAQLAEMNANKKDGGTTVVTVDNSQKDFSSASQSSTYSVQKGTSPTDPTIQALVTE